MNTRTSIIILGIAVLLAIIGGFIWLFLLISPADNDGRGPDEPSGFFGLFPGGEDVRTETPGNGQQAGDGDGTDGSFPDPDQPRLRKLATGPVAGIQATTTGNGVVVRYVERETGHIYEVSPRERTPRRITNTTVPVVYQAQFNDTATRALLQFYDPEEEETRTFLGTLTTDGEEGRLRGQFLSGEVRDPLFSTAGIVHTQRRFSGETAVVIRRQNDAAANLTTIPLHAWRLVEPSGQFAALHTKYANGFPGSLMRVNTASGASEVILSDIPGLLAIPNPSFADVIYTQSSENRLTSHHYSVADATRSAFPITVIPEKCVWGSDTTLYCAVPDAKPAGADITAWYQGRVSFIDQIVRIDIDTNSVSVLARTTDVFTDQQGIGAIETANEFTAGIDAVDLSLDQTGSFLFFVNKKDGSVWSLEIE